MGIESEKDIDEIEVKLNLTMFKPLHAAWITEFYDLMTYDQGKSVIKNGWEASGITGVIESRLVNLSSVDPFADIDPLVTKPTISNNKPLIPEEEIVEREVMLETGTMIQLKSGRWKAKTKLEVHSISLMVLRMMENEHLSLIELSILNAFPSFFILDFLSKMKKCIHKF